MLHMVTCSAGTTFTALFILIQAGEEGIKPGAGATKPASAQYFFLGTSVQMQAMGAHGIALEMQDAMQDSSRCLVTSLVELQKFRFSLWMSFTAAGAAISAILL